MKKSITFLSILVMCLTLSAQEETKLLRFPAIYDNTVVFTYAGDLYIADATNGEARKLTNDPQGF
ncbi:MAG: hypothetical protein IKT02_02545, partial [Bacteroidales bacterium]|nr:hypothetical protein [Bacteroidales bacterium]